MSLTELIDESAVIVCSGSGGVGKTTIAAVIAIEAAKRGRRSVVVTIDPARRLADALGLDNLTNEPQVVAIPGSQASFSALMLDTAATFDELVHRYSVDSAQAEKILANRFYRNVTGALSGTQEYMAAEKLFALHHDERFDLVVVDTPPTRNALDFLDAPGRLTRFLDHRIYRALTTPTRLGLKIANVAAQTVLKTIGRIVGGDVIADVIAFFQAFEGMEGGFKQRATEVIELLHSDTTHFVLVASPRSDTITEACFFADRLNEQGLRVSGIVVNRLYPLFADTSGAAEAPDTSDSPTTTSSEAATGARGASKRTTDASEQALRDNLSELRGVAAEERAVLAPLLAAAPIASLAEIPLLDHDIHDLEGLGIIGGHLLVDVTRV